MLSALNDILGRMISFRYQITLLNPAGPFAGGVNGRTSPVSLSTSAPLLYTGVFFCTFVAGLLFMFQIRRSGRRSCR